MESVDRNRSISRDSKWNAEQGGDLAVAGVAAFTDKSLVFPDSLAFPVPVGHLVGQAAAQSHVPESPLDFVQAAIAAGRGSVMVDDCGAARARRLHQRQHGGVIDVFGIQRGIQFPPQARQDFRKIPRLGSGRREAPGEGGVQVMVRIDQPRHDQAAAGVDGSVRGVAVSGKITHVDDSVSFNVDLAVLDEAVAVVQCHQVSVFDQ
jgi:hypothetical protein